MSKSKLARAIIGAVFGIWMLLQSCTGARPPWARTASPTPEIVAMPVMTGVSVKLAAATVTPSPVPCATPDTGVMATAMVYCR